jgi:hypothetical protein
MHQVIRIFSLLTSLQFLPPQEVLVEMQASLDWLSLFLIQIFWLTQELVSHLSVLLRQIISLFVFSVTNLVIHLIDLLFIVFL